MIRNNSDQIESTEQSFISHLIELRNRLIRSIVVLFALFIVCSFKANIIYSYIAGPLTRHMPTGVQMIAIGVASPFLAPLKLTFFVALIIAFPYILYQTWSFIAPGLYAHEKALALPLLFASVILFYAGMAFAYFVAFPLIFKFIIATAPIGVSVMTDINQYMDFVLSLFFAFGICFQVPIATILLVASGIVSRAEMVEKRPYVILLAFIVGAILTPPDVLSQTLLAIPIWLLFEVGLLFSRFVMPRQVT
jgi:sec-independent protein translocase protein TatC